MPRRILIIEDLAPIAHELRAAVKPVCDAVTACTSPIRGVRLLRQDKEAYDLVITGLVMKELSGFDVIRRIRGQGNPVPIMMITGKGNETTAIEATRLGASDYLDRPVDPAELRARVQKIFASNEARPSELPPPRVQFITQDPEMKAIIDMVGAVARSDSRVLILGETGTGKQLIAQAIHAASPRRKEPFVELNCAAIPENLLESELFGHERGAFTGATERRQGRFEEAGAGTLFLDEIGETGFAVQAKLLRVLQSGRFSRVGGAATLQSHARVIAATNRDLQKESEEGRFREDLFYRLYVITITLPPLRKRPGDIPLLAEHFLRRFSGPAGDTKRFTPDALAWMQRYHWPGNVRELEHFVERLAVLHTEPVIDVGALPPKIFRDTRPQFANELAPLQPLAEARAAFEKEYLERTLRHARGNMSRAAGIAGTDRSNYFRMVRRHGIDPEAFR
jgi:DNA-binding NtrC family response regulator